MVGIISGNTLGLNLGSLAALGARGRIGTAEQGRAGERTYVNVATGDLVLQDQDTSLVGVGSLAAAVRTYNSQGLLTGWRDTPVKSVVKVGTLLRRTDVDGSVCDYIWNATRRVYEAKTAPGSVQDTMIHDASGTYTWTDRATGSKETYQGSGSGLIVSSTDTNGNTLTYSYDASERLSRIDNSNGDALRYTYGTLADGRKTVQIGAQVSGVLRNEVTYTYDTQGRLQEVTIDLDPENKLPAEAKGQSSYKTAYAYEGTSNRISQVSQSDGTKLTLTYVLVNGTYRVETVTDGDGNATKFAYDAAVGASPTLYATAHRTTRVTDPLGVVTAYDSDASGQLVGIRSGVTAANPNGQRWVKYTYNALGDVATVSDSLGSTVTLSYDVYGNLLTQVDTAGNSATWEYNGRNLPLKQTVYRVAANGTTSASGGETTRYAYDLTRNLLRFVVDPTGRITEHRYDAKGLRTCSITYTSDRYDVSSFGDGIGPTVTVFERWAATLDQSKTQRTDYAYDVRGQLMSATTYGGVDASGNGVAATAQTTNYVYDEHGQLLHTWSATSQSDTTYVRDGLGRVAVVVSKTKDGSAPVTTTTLYDDTNATTTVTLSNGLVTKTTYDRAGRLIGLVQSGRDITTGTTRYFYDRDGRLVMTEDPTGKRSWKLYDDLGNQVADVDATGHLTEYVHDADGRLTQTIRYATAVDTAVLVDANGKPTASPADPNAARVTVAQIRVADPAKDEKSWTLYDASGRLAWQVDALGYVTETQYDGASRLIGTRRYATAVDTAGLGDGVGVRFVPAGGAETNVAVNGGVAVVRTRVLPAILNSSDRTTTRIYDAAGLLIGVVDAKGYLTEYVYDAAGRQVETIAYAATAKGFDASTWATLLETARGAHSVAGLKPDPVAPATEPEAIRTYTTYNFRGQVAGKVDGEGYLTEFVYDETGHETQVIRYSDPVKARVTQSFRVDDLRPASDPKAQTTVRTWDGLGRLSTEKNAEGTVTAYEYDALGRVTSKTVALGTQDQRTLLAHYDVMGRVTAELSAEGAKKLTGNQTQPELDAIWAKYGTSTTYDAAGRRTSSTDAKGNRTLYYYDDAGRLRFTIDAEGGVEENTYNALGHLETTTRFASSIGKQELPRLRGGLLSAPENVPTGKLSTGELLDQARHGLDAQGLPGQNSTSIFHYDTRGKVVETIDPKNRIVTSNWNEFGELKRTRETLEDGTETVIRYWRDRLGQVDQVMTFVNGDDLAPLRNTYFTYDAYGRVTDAEDARGNVTKTQYDALGRVITVEDPTHQFRRTTWDAFGRVLTQTDALNQTTSYEYDDAARSVTVTTPEGVKVTTIHNREGQTETVVRWDGIVRPDGTSTPVDQQEDRTTYVYDADGHLKSVTTPLTTTSSVYDEAGRLTDTLDANGNRVHYTYDAANRVLTRTVDPDGLALTTSYKYDAKGQAYLVTDANGVVTQFVFDLNGKVLLQMVDPGGLSLGTTYRYDSRGNVASVMTPGGTFTEYRYDEGNRRIATILHNGAETITERYGYDLNGNLSWRDDANGNHTVFAYDADNRLVYTVDGAGNVKKNEYDADGRVVAVISYVWPLTGYSRFGGPGGDKTGTLLGVDASWPSGYGPTSIADVEARLVTSSGEYGDVVERRVYDRDGRMRFTVDGIGGVVEYTYDRKGNVTERLSYATRISIIDWNPSAGSTPSQKLDVLRAMLQRDAAHDLRVQTAYDLLNRPVATLDATGAVTLIVYDANGNVVAEVAPAKAVSVSVSPSERGFADALVSAARAVRDPARDRCVRNVYDAANRLVWTVDGNGAVTERVYARDRMVKRIAYAKTVSAEAKAFQLVDLRNERTPFTPEFLNAAANVGDYGGSVEAAVTGGPVLQDRVEHFAYDAAGRLTFHVAADGAVTRQVFDHKGNVVLRCAYKDPRNAPVAVWDAPSDAELVMQFSFGEARIDGFVYDDANRLQYTVAADGAVTQNEYDGAGNVVATTRFGARTRACYDLHAENYSNAAAALRADVEQTIGGSDSLAPPNRTTFYAYDAAGRLAYTIAATQVETGRNAAGQREFAQRGFVHSQELDAAGRVVSRTAYETPITNVHHGMTGSELRASTELAASKIQQTRYQYDAAGRLSLVEDPLRFTERYWWDALGNKLTYQDKNGRTWDYDYDAAGRRVRELTPEVKRVHVSTSENDAWSIERVERLVTETVYDALGNITERIEAVGTADQRITSYDYDQVGRRVATIHPEVVVAGRGDPMKLTSRVRYDAFGDAVETIDTAGVSSYAAYDQLGRVAYEIDAEGCVTGYERNAFGETETRTRYAHAPALVLDGDAPTQREIFEALRTIDHARDRVRKTAYDQMGRVALVEDLERIDGLNGTRVGASAKNSYDGFGNLVEVSTLVDMDPVTWSTVTHYYDQRGLEIATIDPLGYLTEQTYDAAGHVLTRTLHAKPSPSWTCADFTHPLRDREDRIETFDYDGDGRLVVANDANGISEAYGYDNEGHRTSYTNRRGFTWSYEYDALGRMVKETSPEVSLTSASVTSSGSVSVQESLPATVVTLVDYDSFGNVTSRTEAVGRLEERTTRYAYDSWGRQVTTILPPVGVYAEESLDDLAANGASGNASRVEVQQTLMTRVGYDQAGSAVVGVDSVKNTSFKVYDRIGRIAYEIDADGYVTRYDRNAFGEVTILTRYATSISAEMAGWSSAPSKRAMDELMTRNVARQDRAITTEYNDLGRVTRVVQPKAWEGDDFAAETTYGYDLAGRLRQTASRIDATHWAATTYICDLKGQQTDVIDAEHYLTTQEYDAFGQVRRRTEYAKRTENFSTRFVTPPDDPERKNRTVEYEYDRLGRKVRETQVGVEYTDASALGSAGNRDSTVYAAMRSVTDAMHAMVDPQALKRADVTTTYGYDAVGNQTRVTDALGHSTYTFHDALGRITAIATSGENQAAWGASDWRYSTRLTTFDRDALGNVTLKWEHAKGAPGLSVRETSANAVSEFGDRTISGAAFDAGDATFVPFLGYVRDRVTRTAYDKRGGAIAVEDAEHFNHYMSYDAAGRLAKTWQTVSQYDATSASVREAATLFTAYRYDRRGNQTQVITPGTNTARDAVLGRIQEVAQESRAHVVTAMNYNAFGEIAERVRYASNGSADASATEWFDYDNAGRLWRTNSGDGVAKVMLHDLMGRVTAQITSAGSKCDMEAVYYSPGSRERGVDIGHGAMSPSGTPLLTLRSVLDLGEAALRRTDYEFDLLGRMTVQRLPVRQDATMWGALDTTLADPEAYRPVIKQTFDRWGNVLTVSDPRNENWVTSFSYNKLNKMVRQTQPEVALYGENGRAAPVTNIYYDQLGRQVAVVDPRGNINAQIYDEAGQVKNEFHADIDLQRDGSIGGIVAHSYNAFGEQVLLRDAIGNHTQYGYDRLGRNTTVTSDPVQVGRSYMVGTTSNLPISYDPGSEVPVLPGPTNRVVTEVVVEPSKVELTTQKLYDEAGRLIADINAADEAVQYAYDLRGNIVATRKPMGQVSRAAFDINDRQVATQTPSGKYGTASRLDAFGRVLEHEDLGGRVHRYTYDLAGKLMLQEDVTHDRYPDRAPLVPAQTVNYQYDQAGQLVTIRSVEYEYEAGKQKRVKATRTHYINDAAGRHRVEQVLELEPIDGDPGNWLQNQVLEYDELGRLVDVNNWSTGTSPNNAHVHYEYDLAGNVMKQVNAYQISHAKEWAYRHWEYPVTSYVKTSYFAYDRMNRQVLVDGDKNNDEKDVANIKLGQGHVLKYDQNGNRVEDVCWGDQLVPYSVWSDYYRSWQTKYRPATGLVTKYYDYDELNRLSGVYVGEFNDPSALAPGAPDPYSIKLKLDTRLYDRASRTVRIGPKYGDLPSEYVQALDTFKGDADGARIRTTVYDSNGEVVAVSVAESTNDWRDTDTLYCTVTPSGSVVPNYTADGNLLGYVTRVYPDVRAPVGAKSRWDVTSITTQAGVEGFLETEISTTVDGQQGTVRKTYDANGFLVQSVDVTKGENNLYYRNDASGHVLRRTQGAQDPQNFLHQMVVNGNVVAVYGLDADGNDEAMFSLGYEPITNVYPSAAIGTYQVRGGDTLEAVALSTYGDASLWYLIADANGLAGNQDLRVGQTLQIPSRIAGTHNTSATFRPYDPSKIVANIPPNIPTPPPPRDKWRLFKVIAVTVIKVVVTVVVSYYAGPVAGAIAGEFTGQFLGLATGLQDHFDWGAVARAGAMGAVTWGVGAAANWLGEAALAAQQAGQVGEAAGAAAATAEAAKDAASAVQQLSEIQKAVTDGAVAALRIATVNAANQCISWASGQQRSFHWWEVAVAVASSAFQYAGEGATRSTGLWSENAGFLQSAGRMLSGTIVGVSSGVYATALKGGRVYAEQIAADAFGNALGNELAVARTPARTDERRDPAYGEQTSPGGLDEIDRARGSAYAPPAARFAETSPGALDEIDRSVEGNSAAQLEAIDRAMSDGSEGGARERPESFTVGKEARRGYWGVSERQLRDELGRAPTSAEILARTKELMSANEGKTVLKVGDQLKYGNGAVSAEAEKTYARMDDKYQESRRAANAMLVSDMSGAFFSGQDPLDLEGLLSGPRMSVSTPFDGRLAAAGPAPGRDGNGVGASRWADLAGPGVVSWWDSAQRSNYLEKIHANSDDAVRTIGRIREDAALTGAEKLVAAEEVAKSVSEERNVVRAATQARISPGGRALSEALEHPPEWPELVVKYGSPDKMQTFENIAKAAGRSSPLVTGFAKVGKVAGPLATVVGVGASAYEIYEAPPEERPRVAAGEVGSFAGGAAASTGGMALGVGAAGWAAASLGLASGPAGWVAIGLGLAGAYAGGGLGSEGGRWMGRVIYDAARQPGSSSEYDEVMWGP